MKISTAVIGTACIVAGSFAAYWVFRVLRFKQALDAFGRDISRSRRPDFEQEVSGGFDREPEDYSGPTDEECEEARRARAEAGYTDTSEVGRDDERAGSDHSQRQNGR